MGKLLITGGSGFVGRFVREGAALGVFGEVSVIAPSETWDIRDLPVVESLVLKEKPDAVLHLAAQSFIPRSFEEPRETFEINLLGTLNVLLALKRADFSGRMIYVSSGDVYGRVAESDLPIHEDTPARPLNPYAASKFAAEQLCLQWHRSESLDVIVARPFNHIGPGQDARFVMPTLARQVVAIARGERAPIIEVGDLDTTRDITDVRDIVCAYAALFKAGRSGETYVVASGKEWRIRDLLSTMCKIMKVDPTIRQDPERIRRCEQRRVVASNQRIHGDTGWIPGISLEQTLNDILSEACQVHGGTNA